MPYVANWITDLRDITDRIHEIHALLSSGDLAAANVALPTEHPYPLPPSAGATES